MFALALTRQVQNLLCAIFLLCALPLAAHAQNTETVDIDTDAFAATSSDTEEVLPVATAYQTEDLAGDRVLGDFVLGPGKVELEIAPGESKTVEITVSNRTGEVKTFDIDVEDMGQTQDPNRPVVLLGDDVGPYTLKDLISIPNLQFDLDHNKRARIPVTISVPPDADPGGRYGSVLVRTVTVDAQPGNPQAGTAPSSAVISRIGTLFFVTVPGDVERGGNLTDFSTKNNQTWYQAGPVELHVLYENTGSIHLTPYGEISVTNMLGEEVGFFELDPWFTLPQSVRLREVSWNRNMLFGRYTATVRLNRGYDDIIDEASLTFYVVPWKLIALGFVLLFLVFFLIRTFFKKFEFSVKAK